jgi:hypothetical protein
MNLSLSDVTPQLRSVQKRRNGFSPVANFFFDIVSSRPKIVHPLKTGAAWFMNLFPEAGILHSRQEDRNA